MLISKLIKLPEFLINIDINFQTLVVKQRTFISIKTPKLFK